VVGDDDEKPDETGGFTRATSVEPKIGPATLQSSPLREQTEAHGYLGTYTTKFTTEPIDRPISPSAALPQYPCGRVVSEDDHRAAAVASPPSAITPPLPRQSEARTPALEQDEWEFRKIVGKRRVGKGYEYKVRWKDTWLPTSELGNAQRLLREFEARHQPRP